MSSPVFPGLDDIYCIFFWASEQLSLKQLFIHGPFAIVQDYHHGSRRNARKFNLIRTPEGAIMTHNMRTAKANGECKKIIKIRTQWQTEKSKKKKSIVQRKGG